MTSRSDSTRPTTPLFSPGRFLATPGALETLARFQIHPSTLLSRHLSGDWGDVCIEDAQANDEAVRQQLRIFSVYVLKPPLEDAQSLGTAKVWVITEADRSATTLLLPEEY